MSIKRLFRKSVLFLAIRVIGLALSFVAFMLLAKAMTQTAFGLFSMAFSAVLLMTPVLSLGRREVAERFIPRMQALDDPQAARNIALEGWRRLGLMAGLFFCLAGAAISAMWGFGIGLGPVHLSLALASALLLLATMASEYQMHVLRGYGKLAWAIAPRELGWRVLSIALIGGVLLWGVEIGPNSAVLLMGGTLTVVVLVQHLMNPEARLTGLRAAPPLQADAARAARLIWLPNVLNTSFPHLVPLIVGVFIAPAESAIVFIAQRIANLLQLPYLAERVIAVNAISQNVARNDLAEIQRTIPRLTGLVTLAGVAGFACLVVLGRFILGLFGDEYADSLAILLILAIGTTANTAFGPLGAMLQTAGRELSYSIAMYLSNALSIVMLFGGLYFFGVMGAVWASALQVILWNLALLVLVRVYRLPDVSLLGLIFPVRFRS